MTPLLIVDGLSPDVTPEHLTTVFGVYGEVQWARIVTDHFGHSLAFAYVQMDRLETADAARTALNGQQLLDSCLRVDYAKPSRVL